VIPTSRYFPTDIFLVAGELDFRRSCNGGRKTRVVDLPVNQTTHTIASIVLGIMERSVGCQIEPCAKLLSQSCPDLPAEPLLESLDRAANRHRGHPEVQDKRRGDRRPDGADKGHELGSMWQQADEHDEERDEAALAAYEAG